MPKRTNPDRGAGEEQVARGVKDDPAAAKLVIEVLETGRLDLKRAGLLAYLLGVAGEANNCGCVGVCGCRTDCGCKATCPGGRPEVDRGDPAVQARGRVRQRSP